MIQRNAVWDADPVAYERRRGWDSWLEQRRLGFWRDWVSAAAGQALPHVLEIGSGTGGLVRRLAPLGGLFASWTGVEPLAAYVDYARKLVSGDRRVSFVCGEGERLAELGLPLPSYDAVVSTDVLHHVEDLSALVMRAVSAVARSGAVWGVMEPNVWHPYVAACQILREGERNFFSSLFLREAERFGWRCEARRNLLAIPAFVPHPPQWMKEIEQRFEGNRFIGGALFLGLRKE